MNLKRKWPAVCIWVLFIIFDVFMVASSSFYSGLFPSSDNLLYSAVLTVLSILIMGILTFLLGRVSDHFRLRELKEYKAFGILYFAIICLILIGATCFRIQYMAESFGDNVGNIYLYENAQIGSEGVSLSFDLLSAFYQTILRGILLFTGNKISVAFFFEIALFVLFILCGTLTVKKLLGDIASIVFASFLAFMPIFTDNIKASKLGTEALFIAMYGIELLVVATYLRGISDKKYKSKLYIIWYLIVGAAIGFMTYVDLGTFLVILPLLVAQFFILNISVKEELLRLLFVLIGVIVSFFAMIVQESGFMMADVTLTKYFMYYLNNVNEFRTFWTYTDYKIVYLVTLVAMSGIFVGFWKNRNLERVSPWLLSLFFVFATVPFMGKTRMNDQLMVTIYYGFTLACVMHLITFPKDETGLEEEAKDIEENTAVLDGYTGDVSEIVTPDEPMSPVDGITVPVEDGAMQDKTIAPVEDGVIQDKTIASVEDVAMQDSTVAPVKVSAAQDELATPAEGSAAQDELTINEETTSSSKNVKTEELKPVKKERFVPEGMVLPEDDDDGTPNEAPKMKMPEFKGKIALERNGEKREIRRKKQPPKTISRKDDFDIAFKPGDDFDI